ncbi:MAG: geranylgeranyl reductase family protein [Promethearchaeia archaeon]
MEKLNQEFDVIIVGAGTGGSIAARFAAEDELKVCLIDTKKKAEIGDKICGDAVGEEIFNFLNIEHPKGKELSCHVEGGKLYPPNMNKSITLTDPKQAGYIIHRLEFGQRLLGEALNGGVDVFLDRTTALDLIYENDQVCGVKAKLKNGETLELRAKIVIDASGFYSPLRKKIQSDLIENDISKKDSILCYREIINFPTNDQAVMDKNFITIILDQQKAPGGYIWYFPKNDHSINIGLGVYMHYKGKVKDFYHKNVFNQFVETTNFEIESSGGGVVPVRRPLWSCAEAGIMFVGDAACQVNPLHGGGIDPSMRAGYYAAKTAKEAIEANDYSLSQLWSYNVDVMRNFGAEFAALDLLRIVLQRLDNKALNFGLEKDLLTSSEILNIASKGQVKLSISDMLSKALKGIAQPKLLLDLNYLRIQMDEISHHYRNFPSSPVYFKIWKKEAIKIYDKIKNTKFG